MYLTPKHRAEVSPDRCTCKVVRSLAASVRRCDLYIGKHRWTGADR